MKVGTGDQIQLPLAPVCCGQAECQMEDQFRRRLKKTPSLFRHFPCIQRQPNYAWRYSIFLRKKKPNAVLNEDTLSCIDCHNIIIRWDATACSSLTFKNRASYIQDGRTATLQMLHFIYFFFSTNISTEYFKHIAHSPFFLFKMPFIS